jgi:DNA ligase-1
MELILKPQLAEDALIEQIRFPCIVQPKFDGVRALNINGTLTGRSLDPFQGFGVTAYFSQRDFKGFDGEMVLGPNPLSTDRLCNRTSGAMGKFKGITEMADLHWWIFDDFTYPSMPYEDRYELAADRVARLDHPRIHIFPSDRVGNRAKLDRLIAGHLDNGAEGTMVKNPFAIFKSGRATQSGQENWRIKPWSHAEILVTKIVEGEQNTNAAKLNTLGQTERSSSKKGKVKNGQIGSLRGPLLADILHPITRELLLSRGTMVTVGSGEMSVKEATYWFQHQELILNHIVTFKFMPHGMKDAPRMPTFKSKRLKEDMS